MTELRDKIIELYKKRDVPALVTLAYNNAKDFFGDERVELKTDADDIPYFNNRWYEDHIDRRPFDSTYGIYLSSRINNTSLSEDEYCRRFVQILQENPTSYSYFIVIHYPECKITNEYGNNTTIQNLFILLAFNSSGVLHNILGVKSTFSSIEYKVRYIHSHLPRLDTYEPNKINSFCLGTGPLNNTLNNLNSRSSVEEWKLFYWELDKYAHTESLRGGPYIKLNDINSNNTFISEQNNTNPVPYVSNLDVDIHSTFKNICKEYFKEAKSYNYNGYGTSLAIPINKFYIDFSNAAIRYMNNICTNELEKNYIEGIFNTYSYKNAQFYRYYNSNNPTQNRISTSPLIIRFKDKDYNLTVNDTTESLQIQLYNLINIGILNTIYNNINRVLTTITDIHTNYGNNTTEQNIYNKKIIL